MTIPGVSKVYHTPFRTCVDCPAWRTKFTIEPYNDGDIQFDLINRSIYKGDSEFGWASIQLMDVCREMVGDTWLEIHFSNPSPWYKSGGNLRISWEIEREIRIFNQMAMSPFENVVVFVPTERIDGIILKRCSATLQKNEAIEVESHPPVARNLSGRFTERITLQIYEQKAISITRSVSVPSLKGVGKGKKTKHKREKALKWH